MRSNSIIKIVFGLILGLSLPIIWQNCKEKKTELDLTQVYKIEIKNEVLIGFIEDYVQEMKDLINSKGWIVTLTANKVNSGFHYRLDFANHALYAGLGSATVEGRKERNLTPPLFYTTIDEVIVLKHLILFIRIFLYLYG